MKKGICILLFPLEAVDTVLAANHEKKKEKKRKKENNNSNNDNDQTNKKYMSPLPLLVQAQFQ